MARLGDICSKASSGIRQLDLENRNGKYPIYGAGGFIKTVDFYEQKKPYVAVVKDGAGVGRVMYLPAFSSVIGTMQYIIPNAGTNAQYLAYAMDFLNLSKYYTGTTIPHIYFKDYCQETLPDYSEKEQLYIASVLAKIDGLIGLHQQQIAKLDELVKARFVEMFGHPAINNLGWNRVKLHDCLRRIDSGKSLNCEGFSRKNALPAILKLSAVTYGEFNPNENKQLPSVSDFIPELEVHNGDLLFTRKNTYEYVGMTAYVRETPPNLMLPDLIFRLIPSEQCSPVYLGHLINHTLFRPAIRELAGGSSGSMPNIAKSRLLELEIPLPPVDIQKEFESLAERIYKSKTTVHCALAKLETLKASLMQEYFGRVPYFS